MLNKLIKFLIHLHGTKAVRISSYLCDLDLNEFVTNSIPLMKQYRYINNLMGWFTFLIAAVVYCMTVEPTASFWDCPEFITTGYKLEVGTPARRPVLHADSQLVFPIRQRPF